MNADAITIYHNPDCGTSRNTLALMQASGLAPEVIEYLKTPPDRATLRSLIARAGVGAREMLRVKSNPRADLQLDAPGITEEELIGHMLEHPILINRPLVVAPLGVKLCRPADIVLDLLPRRSATFLKEDGSAILVDTLVGAGHAGLCAALAEARLAIDDLAEPGRRFYAYQTLAGEPVGYGGFERYGRDLLLRSIVVLPAARKRGIGGGILALLLRRAFDLGARQAWLLTTGAAEFFERAGFRQMQRSEAPPAVLNTRQMMSLCPSSAALLGRAITL